MANKGPGKSFRKGISLFELAKMFPDEEAARLWFEGIYWAEGRHCGHCGSTKTGEVPNAKPMPYWCTDCRSYFSVRTGTAMEKSRLPLHKWALAVYLYVTSLKGISSMRLHREINVSQKTAWYMLHRLRGAWGGLDRYEGPVEIDETYIGGKRKNLHAGKRAQIREEFGWGGSAEKACVIGAKDRATNRVQARVIPVADKAHLYDFTLRVTPRRATVYTDDHGGYRGVPFRDHDPVCHSAGQYVNGKAHTNGIESFWAMFKRGFHGTFHHMSRKHLQRYISEFTTRHNIRRQDTIDQMRHVVASMVGKRLRYRELVA